MSVLPESFKNEKDPNLSYYTTGLKCIKISLRMQADLFKKSKLSVPGERKVIKLVRLPGTSVAK